MNIEEFYKAAGGSLCIAQALKRNQWTVDRWKTTGIPLKHWETLINLYDITAGELYLMNKNIELSRLNIEEVLK